MQQINCYIPIKVRIIGELSDAEIEQLGETLVRMVAARIAFAGRMLSNGQPASVTSILGEGQQRLTLLPAAYPLSGSAMIASEADGPKLVEPEDHDYAFFFAGGAYGRAAEAFIREFYPDHHRYNARSFEEMFHTLLLDIRRRSEHAKRSGRRLRVREIVMVTHASASGRLYIPLMRGDEKRTRFITPTDIANLQQEFRRNLKNKRLQLFRSERREVAAALDEDTRIVVRGCEFGQADEALDTLRIFLGGRPLVFATRGFQGFEIQPIGKGLFKKPEDAYDFLVQQEYLPPPDEGFEVAEKRRYIAKLVSRYGGVPTDFFIMSHEDYNRFKALSQVQRLGPGAGGLKRRPYEAGEPEVRADLPSGGRFWSFSAPPPLGYDPKLDALSINELVARARSLNNPYRPHNAAMLLRLRAAWVRKWSNLVLLNPPSDDPLGGLPDPPAVIFGDPDVLARDAAEYPGEAPDIFEEETLPRRPRRTLTPEQLEAEQEADEVQRVFEETAASSMREPREEDYPAHGRVEMLPDGIRLWNFAVGSSRLHPEFSAPLKQFAQRVGLQPNMLIRVDGHTSTSGSEKGNQRLSQARSDAVRQFLIDAGVSASRIEAKGHGETSPLERERKRNGQLIPRSMARNRRVEVRQHAQAAISTPSKAELEATIRRTGPPPAHRPEWIMWVYNNVLSPFGTAQTVAEWTARFSKIDIEARLDMASLIETVAWIFFSTAASYSEGQAIGYANGAKRGFASALVAMSKSVTDPPTGKIVFPSDEPPLDIKAIPYNEGAQDGYRKGVQTAIQLIGNLQNESPHGGEIFLLGLRYVYGNKMYRSMVDLLGGEERRFPTPIPWWLRLLSGESK